MTRFNYPLRVEFYIDVIGKQTLFEFLFTGFLCFVYANHIIFTTFCTQIISFLQPFKNLYLSAHDI